MRQAATQRWRWHGFSRFEDLCFLDPALPLVAEVFLIVMEGQIKRIFNVVACVWQHRPCAFPGRMRRGRQAVSELGAPRQPPVRTPVFVEGPLVLQRFATSEQKRPNESRAQE